jgi:hypothetical protein
MTRLRGALGPIVGVWLVCQIVPQVLASATAWVPLPAAAGLACTCPQDADGACPMHKKQAGSTLCLLRGANDSRTAILGSLFGPVGLLPAPRPPTVRTFIGTMSLVAVSSVTGRTLPPDPPPPRS